MNRIFRRAVAFYVDALIFSIPAYWIYSTIFFKTVEDSHSRFGDFKVLLVQILSYILYFTVCEFFFRKTIGKSLFKYRVEAKGEKISFIQVLMRSFYRIVPINQISFLFNDEKVFWHERWSKIYTIKKNDVID